MLTELAKRFSAISDDCLIDDKARIAELSRYLSSDTTAQSAITCQAAHWITTIREQHPIPHGIEALLLEYPLSKPEGVALMCLAEALLRIPDTATADQLIRDLLNPVAWEQHLGHSDSLFVNAASWGLAQSGRWLHATDLPQGKHIDWLRGLTAKLGEPILRQALKQAMRYLANQFVLGESLSDALSRAKRDWHDGATHSFDMLGEAALTSNDSARYWLAYRDALAALCSVDAPPNLSRPSLSIKLSALHPRYHTAHQERLKH
ncbi:MAG TPA: bifunctional proline dehydrogenase/L-glutamate gamma-semialdehyde dehydrogenase, partial [Spongiibacteraceae bacterium]|nr:bifunctional proline dehydrogenase/L-glutamate gamma-semialdehyde dehydrogenase [Spongiibacteraceae bacterium]